MAARHAAMGRQRGCDPAYTGGMSELFRHIEACNNTSLPGGRVPVLVVGERGAAGSSRDRGPAAGARGADAAARRSRLRSLRSCSPSARRWPAEGAFRWRGEAFDVRATPGRAGAGADRPRRAAAFGIEAAGVHRQRAGRGRRRDPALGRAPRGRQGARSRQARPSRRGRGAGRADAGETLIKEAEEEAGPAAGAGPRSARRVGTIAYAMQRPEGLRRDRLHCYDLVLPAGFVPGTAWMARSRVSSSGRWPRVLETVRRTDAVQVQRQPGADRPVPAARPGRGRRGRCAAGGAWAARPSLRAAPR